MKKLLTLTAGFLLGSAVACQCPFCGPSLPNNITRLMRKGYYLAVTWIDYLVGQIVGELETLGHKDDTVIAVVGDHVS